ncbi:hypothetical protein OOK31_31440 [Streptomyces sp. NBC_00249]|uniref:hypothetical protein n=1 Tax=Streptomyces sp. NBC_00249 TaxID=2975690 RepID=UPI0022522C63|nr:hypothetical protein [Streptomyces sp. NBC_00249]MCX5198350.1 hypothetical protein [Streptomyces sp. NBC_00249]
MRRGLVHAMAWLLATAAAVTLSWWGVHTVMSGTAYDPPLAVPLATRPLSSSTQRADPPPPPSPTPSAVPSPTPSPSASPSASPSGSAPAGKPKSSPPAGARPAPAPAPEPGGGEVKGYTVTGGRVVLDLGAASAELVSATPAAGWRMQVWKQDVWIRVTFTRDGRESSVFCTWHDTAPRVEFDER